VSQNGAADAASTFGSREGLPAPVPWLANAPGMTCASNRSARMSHCGADQLRDTRSHVALIRHVCASSRRPLVARRPAAGLDEVGARCEHVLEWAVDSSRSSRRPACSRAIGENELRRSFRGHRAPGLAERRVVDLVHIFEISRPAHAVLGHQARMVCRSVNSPSASGRSCFRNLEKIRNETRMRSSTFAKD